MFVLLSSFVYADYFDDLNRILERNNQNSGLIWNYEIIKQDDQFNVDNIIITDSGTNLTIDYTITNITKKMLKDFKIKKVKDNHKHEPLPHDISNLQNISDIDTNNWKKIAKDSYTGKSEIQIPNDFDILHIGNGSAVVNVTINMFSKMKLLDIFIYDLTKDHLNYNLWRNDSIKSWFNHTKGNLIWNYYSSFSTASGASCATGFYAATDSLSTTNWDCTDTGTNPDFTIDMGRDVRFNRVDMYMHTSYQCGFNISSSYDNITYTKVFRNTTSFNGLTKPYLQETTPTDIAGRYFRFNFTNCVSNRAIIFDMALMDTNVSGTFPIMSYMVYFNSGIDIVEAENNTLWKRLSNHLTYNNALGIKDTYSTSYNSIYAYDGSMYFSGSNTITNTASASHALNRFNFYNDSQMWYTNGQRYCFQGSDGTCTTYKNNFSAFDYPYAYEAEGALFSDAAGFLVPFYAITVKNMTIQKKVNYSAIKVYGNSRYDTTTRDWTNMADGSTYTSQGWSSASGTTSGVFLTFDLGQLYNISAITLRFLSPDATLNPSSVYVYGSTDNLTFTPLSFLEMEQGNTLLPDTNFGYNIKFDNPMEYRYFNFSFPSCDWSTTYMSLGEMEFFDADSTRNRVLTIMGQQGYTIWVDKDNPNDYTTRAEPLNDTSMGYVNIYGNYLTASNSGYLVIADVFGLYLIDKLYTGKQTYLYDTIPLQNINDVNFLTNDTFIVSTLKNHIIYNFTSKEIIKKYNSTNITSGSSTIMMKNSPVNPREVYIGTKGESTGSVNRLYTLANQVLNFTNSTDNSDMDVSEIFALRNSNIHSTNFYWVDYIIFSTLKTVYAWNVTSLRKSDAINPIIDYIRFSNTSKITTSTNISCNIIGYDDTNMLANITIRLDGAGIVSQREIPIFNNYTYTSLYLDAGNLSAGNTVTCSANISDIEGNTVQNTTSIIVSAALPGACSLLSPANASTQTDSPKTLDWTNSSGATYYHVYGDNSTGQTLLKNVTDSDVSWHDLLSGQKYYWKVVAYNAGGSTNCSSNNKFEFTMAISGMSSDQDIRLQRVYNCTINGTDCYGNWTTELLNRTKSINRTVSGLDTTLQKIFQNMTYFEEWNVSFYLWNNTYFSVWNNSIMNLTEDWSRLWNYWNCSYADNKICDYLNKTNVTIGRIRTSQKDNYRIELSDFPAIVADKKYYAQLNVFEYTGNATNLTSLPTITILDSLRNVMVTEAEFNWTREGVYNYTYDTSSSAVSGVWESIVTANYSNRTIVLNDYWQISSSPADVVIPSMASTALPSIIANVEISNVGTADSDFYYVYCLVNTSENQCGDGDDVDYTSATRFITAGSTWTTTLTLTGTKTGTHYFKVKARALLETVWAGASKQFDITPEEGVEGPSLGSGAGGGGSTGTPIDIGKCMSDADCEEGYTCDANGFCSEISREVLLEKIEDVNRAINILLKSPFAYIVAITFIVFLITKRAYKEEEDDNSEETPKKN